MAVDAHTGEIKAIIGGRDYGQSQLNHALSHRQPGSVFKPFVYAAAFNNAVDGAQPIVTPATTVDDEPTVFEFDGQEYTPNNYGERFMGRVTARQALTNSLNIATVKIAELVGYGRVVQIARQMGVPANMRPTPAVALGAYEMTPLEVAGAYTGFATVGTRAEPYFMKNVIERGREHTGEIFSGKQTGAGSARRLPGRQRAAGCAQQGHRRGSAAEGIYPSGGRKDGNIA